MNRRTSLTAIAALAFFAAGARRTHAGQLGKELNEADARLNTV